jgi:hypothetical protein
MYVDRVAGFTQCVRGKKKERITKKKQQKEEKKDKNALCRPPENWKEQKTPFSKMFPAFVPVYS